MKDKLLTALNYLKNSYAYTGDELLKINSSR